MRTDLTPLEELDAAQRARVFAALDPRLWALVMERGDGQCWDARGPERNLRVIWSIATELDGRAWLHVSVSRPDRLPSYSDMQRVQTLFVGIDRTAYSVWPRRDRHINLHEHCLHLWAVLEGDEPLPDFSRGGQSI
jgi:hypothetical protein